MRGKEYGDLNDFLDFLNATGFAGIIQDAIKGNGERYLSEHLNKESSINDQQSKLKEHRDKISHYKIKIEEYEKEVSALEDSMRKLSWTEHEDTLRFEEILVESNFDSWRETKEVFTTVEEEPCVFFFEIEEGSESCTGLTIGEAKKLVEYLSQKIDFLES